MVVVKQNLTQTPERKMRYQPTAKNRAPKHRPIVRTASMIAEDKARAVLAEAALARLEAKMAQRKTKNGA